jgi:ketosteroid isomerase-like protein
MPQVAAPIKEDVRLIDEIRQRNMEFLRRFAQGDAAGVAALYTPDAVVFPPNMEMMTGRDVIATLWQGAMNMGVTKATLTTMEAEPAGPYALEYGVYEMFAGDAKVDWGKYMVFWRKDGGEWFLHRDMWNSSQPAEMKE